MERNAKLGAIRGWRRCFNACLSRQNNKNSSIRCLDFLMANILIHQLSAPAEVPWNFSSGALSCYRVKRSYPQNSVWCIVWGRYLEQASAKIQYLQSPEEWQSSVNMPTRAGSDNYLSPVFHIKRTRWCQWRISENMCSKICTMANSCFPPDHFNHKVLFFPLCFSLKHAALPPSWLSGGIFTCGFVIHRCEKLNIQLFWKDPSAYICRAQWKSVAPSCVVVHVFF